MRINQLKLLFLSGALSFLAIVACGGKPEVTGGNPAGFSGGTGEAGEGSGGTAGSTGGTINFGMGGADGGEGGDGTVAPCGNGELGAGEQCDDGGNADGDGCSSTCQLEPGFE